MRNRCLLIVLLLVSPAVVRAQLANRPDSVGLVRAIAKAIVPPIRSNGKAGYIMVSGTSLPAVSKFWNPQVAFALKEIDSTFAAKTVSRETMRVNISSLDVVGDSAAVSVGLSRCNAGRFIGASAFYSFKQTRGQWTVVSEQKGPSARGSCPKAYGKD